MRSIWKYPLKVDDLQEISLLGDFEILCVQSQHDLLFLWAAIDPGSPHETFVKVAILGTGHPADGMSGMQYIGTFQIYDGGFVGHVFVSQVKSNDPGMPKLLEEPHEFNQ